MKRKLRILYISQYFPPEVGATQTRAVEMAGNLVRQGHEVTVLTEFPNHPSGIIPPEYRGKLFQSESIDGISVRRSWVYTTPNKTFVTRMLFYLTFMVSAFFSGLFTRGRFDVVYATSPPFFVGITGWLLSLLKGGDFVFEVRDIWPESAVVLGELNNPHYIRWAEKLELLYYRKAARIVVVTQGIYDRLKERGIPEEKLLLIKNGTNTEIFKNHGRGKREVLGLGNKFTVCYAGIFGIAQGMEQLCELIEEMKEHSDIHFLFIGNGPKRALVEQLKKDRQLDNMTLLQEIPREEIAAYISACDVSLVPLKKNDLFLGALPSKMFDHMACERPIILSVDGEARRVLEDAKAGIFVEPENTEQMKAAILKLKSDPQQALGMGQNGRRLVERSFSRRQQALQLEQALMELGI